VQIVGLKRDDKSLLWPCEGVGGNAGRGVDAMREGATINPKNLSAARHSRLLNYSYKDNLLWSRFTNNAQPRTLSICSFLRFDYETLEVLLARWLGEFCRSALFA